MTDTSNNVTPSTDTSEALLSSETVVVWLDVGDAPETITVDLDVAAMERRLVLRAWNDKHGQST